MRAATIRDGEVLVEEHPDPEPGKGEVLVRVRAAGINGGDLHQRDGRYPAPPGWPPDIPGMELAGEIVGPAGRGGVAPVALVQVAAVDAGGPHAQQHLALPGLRVGMVLDQYLAVSDRRGSHGGRF